jgi:hypothetical protein
VSPKSRGGFWNAVEKFFGLVSIAIGGEAYVVSIIREIDYVFKSD